jgi:hypothetical protein
MALETLKGVTHIGEFEVMADRPRKDDGSVDWALFDEMRKAKPIYIDHDINTISFRIQNGPIKEVGVNGCQIDDMIRAAAMIIDGLNQKFPCTENDIVLGHLQSALHRLESRRINRVARGVEGESKA